MEEFNIKPYLKHRDELKDTYKQVVFRKAVEEIEQYIATQMVSLDYRWRNKIVCYDEVVCFFN